MYLILICKYYIILFAFKIKHTYNIYIYIYKLVYFNALHIYIKYFYLLIYNNKIKNIYIIFYKKTHRSVQTHLLRK